MVLNQDHGVILSPRYPDIVIVSCSWRIAVPRDHFAVITVHDLERQVDNCNGGLQIRARQNCPNNSIPPGLICKLKASFQQSQYDRQALYGCKTVLSSMLRNNC